MPARQSIRVRYADPRLSVRMTNAGVTDPVTRRLRQSHAALSHGDPLPKQLPDGQQHRNCSPGTDDDPHENV